jgi:hypothetical protein
MRCRTSFWEDWGSLPEQLSLAVGRKLIFCVKGAEGEGTDEKIRKVARAFQDRASRNQESGKGKKDVYDFYRERVG